MKIGEAQRYISDGLKKIYEEAEAVNISQWLLEAFTGNNQTNLLLKRQEDLSAEEEEKIEKSLQRLQQHEPVQYVLNKAWFYGMELYVDKNVLIPRPETEELVHWIVADAKASGLNVFDKNPNQADATTQLKILDVGTGSGCIALALKKELPRAEVWGCDVSEEALNVARRNGAALNIRVDFQGLDFLDETRQTALPNVDVLVSNPPYIPLRDKESMQPNVVAYEPHTALFVPNNDPLLFYKAIAAFAKKRLYQNGALYLEIHEELAKDVVALFRSEGYHSVEVRKDMQGKERMVRAYPAAPKEAMAQAQNPD